ncbi:hypothetical protein EMCRGX_G004497 [Ephydatia muelleri]
MDAQQVADTFEGAFARLGAAQPPPTKRAKRSLVGPVILPWGTGSLVGPVTRSLPGCRADFDCILHVNPRINNRGLAMVFNPTGSTLSWNLTLPLYYTGISNKAQVFREGISTPTAFSLDRDYSISIPVKMTPTSITWFPILSKD